MPPPTIPTPDREELESCISEGFSNVIIGVMYGVSKTTVMRWLNNYGIKRHRGRGHKTTVPEEAVRAAWERHRTVREVATALGIGATRAGELLQEVQPWNKVPEVKPAAACFPACLTVEKPREDGDYQHPLWGFVNRDTRSVLYDLRTYGKRKLNGTVST